MKTTIYTIALLSLVSCTTMRNAENRHDRIVKNFPSVHQTDTITVEKIVTVKTPAQIIKGETIFEKCPDAGEELTATETLKDGTTIQTTLKGNVDGTKSLNTKVNVPEKEHDVVIKEVETVTWQNRPLEWWQTKVGFCVCMILIGSLFFGLARLDIKINGKKQDYEK